MSATNRIGATGVQQRPPLGHVRHQRALHPDPEDVVHEDSGLRAGAAGEHVLEVRGLASRKRCRSLDDICQARTSPEPTGRGDARRSQGLTSSSSRAGLRVREVRCRVRCRRGSAPATHQDQDGGGPARRLPVPGPVGAPEPPRYPAASKWGEDRGYGLRPNGRFQHLGGSRRGRIPRIDSGKGAGAASTQTHGLEVQHLVGWRPRPRLRRTAGSRRRRPGRGA